MITLLLQIALLSSFAPTPVAKFETCVWPNTCTSQIAFIAPCGAGHYCKDNRIAQFQPCVWPNKCKQESQKILAQFTPCVWPNKCVEQNG